MSNIVLELKNAAIYQRESLILSEVDVTIYKGDFVYLIGKTGTGKSSFMKTLYGDLPLSEGEGSIVDYNLRTLKEKDIPFLRRKLGVVFQDFKLMEDRTIFDNLAFVLQIINTSKRLIRKKATNALTEVGLLHKQYNYPSELSGGEKQRIAIARAIINDPMILLADEPTGNLDPETAFEILEIFKKINKNGTTVIIATHNYDLVKKTDAQILKLDSGKIIKVVLKQKQINTNS